MAVSPPAFVESQLEIIFKRIHLSSKILAAFPFKLHGNKYKIASLELVYSLIALIVYGYIAGYMGYHHLLKKVHLMMRLSQTLPHLTVFSLLLVNVIWLAININTMSDIFQVLKQIHAKTNARLNYSHNKYMWVFSSSVVIEFIAIFFYYNESYFTQSYGTIVFVFLVTFAIVDQFSSLLEVIRLFYKHICEELNSQTAEQFTDIHDMLAQCCGLVNHCYSPQLLLVSLSAVIYNVSLLYISVTQFQSTGMFDVPCIVATLMFFIIVLHFTRSCRLTKLQSERFNKLLYRLIINDDSRVLMRNKRIMLHYKGTKDLQFSAIGFIDVDYPLICSMVSTATTYILILVQFTSREYS